MSLRSFPDRPHGIVEASTLQWLLLDRLLMIDAERIETYLLSCGTGRDIPSEQLSPPALLPDAGDDCRLRNDGIVRQRATRFARFCVVGGIGQIARRELRILPRRLLISGARFRRSEDPIWYRNGQARALWSGRMVVEDLRDRSYPMGVSGARGVSLITIGGVGTRIAFARSRSAPPNHGWLGSRSIPAALYAGPQHTPQEKDALISALFGLRRDETTSRLKRAREIPMDQMCNHDRADWQG